MGGLGGRLEGRRKGETRVYISFPFCLRQLLQQGSVPSIAPAPARQVHHGPASTRWSWPLDSGIWSPLFVPLAQPSSILVATTVMANGWTGFWTSSIVYIANDLCSISCVWTLRMASVSLVRPWWLIQGRNHTLGECSLSTGTRPGTWRVHGDSPGFLWLL